MPVFAGQRSSASYWNSLSDWGSYTPQLTAAGGGLNLGADGEADGWWSRNGRVVRGYARFLFSGAGVDGGTGVYDISLPFPADPDLNSFSTIGGEGTAVGSGKMRDLSTSANGRNLVAQLASASPATVVMRFSGSNGNLGQGVPITWASGDRLSINFRYFVDVGALPSETENQRLWRDGGLLPAPQSWRLDRVHQYTPQMFGTTVNPEFGDQGFAVGWWRTSGFMVSGEMRFLFAGDGIVSPQGAFRFSLPVPLDDAVIPNPNGSAGGNFQIIEGFVRDDDTPANSASLVGQIMGTAELGGFTGHQLVALFADSNDGSITNTLTDQDRISARFMYPADPEIIIRNYT